MVKKESNVDIPGGLTKLFRVLWSTELCKGYGFITMTDDAGAARAIQAFDSMEIDGRTLNVRFAEEKQPDKPAASPRSRQQGQAASPRRDNRTEAPRPKRPRRPL
ncbi:hypothetical protein [Mucilaginibacter sp.]|uniref:hypothetical protein n=1 Tax=Mucilaginibacter sp. TaxID=1882438 RepID=UPI00263580A9|nr:hypothetical protein [Mucilaginibacter sp.]